MIRSVVQAFNTNAINYAPNINNALRISSIPFSTFVPTRPEGFALYSTQQCDLVISTQFSTSSPEIPLVQGTVPANVVIEVPWSSADADFSPVLNRYLFSTFIIQGAAAGSIYMSLVGSKPVPTV